MSNYRRRLMMRSEKGIKPYMHFEALEDGLTISLSKNSIEYSLDGSTWVTLPANTASPAINTGEKIYVKGEIKSTETWEGSGTFTTSKKCNVGGNIMSLLYSDDFENQYTLTQSWVFACLFLECQIINVSEDLLPATTLSPYCYYWLFGACQSLLTAPKLPATILTRSCYEAMYYYCTKLTTVSDLLAPILVEQCYSGIVYGCSSVNYIKMMAIDISAQNCLLIWVEGVASSGTFVKNSAMTSLPTGDNGIPSGWTVVNDGEESGGGDAVIIEFTINGNPMEPTATYKAEEGMTFGEWVNSKYNTNGFYVWTHPVLGEIVVTNIDNFVYVDNRFVTPNDIILQDGDYSLP